jgi:hypothetical protein
MVNKSKWSDRIVKGKGRSCAKIWKFRLLYLSFWVFDEALAIVCHLFENPISAPHHKSVGGAAVPFLLSKLCPKLTGAPRQIGSKPS